MDSINAAGVDGWRGRLGVRDFHLLLWFFRRTWFTGTGRAGPSGIMTPWALENVALYQQYGSVDAALRQPVKLPCGANPVLNSYNIFLGGTGATLGLIIAVFIVSHRADHRQGCEAGAAVRHLPD